MRSRARLRALGKSWMGHYFVGHCEPQCVVSSGQRFELIVFFSFMAALISREYVENAEQSLLLVCSWGSGKYLKINVVYVFLEPYSHESRRPTSLVVDASCLSQRLFEISWLTFTRSHTLHFRHIPCNKRYTFSRIITKVVWDFMTNIHTITHIAFPTCLV